MKNSTLPLFSTLTWLFLFPLALAQAQEVKKHMDSIYEPFKKLQVYLADSDLFQSGQNEPQIKELLSQIISQFHTVEQMPSRFRSQPGFEANVKMVTELLQDSQKRLDEGKKAYAWWRLRTLPGHCFGCHSTYQVTTTFKDAAEPDPSLDALKKARFFLATRQLPEAREALVAVIKNPNFKLYHIEALRGLLVIFTRIQKTPNEAIETFTHLLETTDLPEEEKAEVQTWITSLKQWAKEKTPLEPTIANAERLLSSALKSADPFLNSIDAVSVLRGTALLHNLLERGGVTPSDKSKALYLLGASYSHLPMFFTGGWPEMYLEQCILEFPGTPEAKKSFLRLREYITEQFTGSAGTALPADVKLHLDDLRKRAYDIPTLTGQS